MLLGFEVGFALQLLRLQVLGTSRRTAGTGPWSCGREPALAVSPHPGNSPWRKKRRGGRGGPEGVRFRRVRESAARD
jgi:hypothetical protein